MNNLGNFLDFEKEKEVYFSPTKGQMSCAEMIDDIAFFMQEDPSSMYKLIIGSDSQARTINGQFEVDFVTAIIVYREKKGARYFWRKEKKKRKPILKDKIYTETFMSLSVAQAIIPEINKYVVSANYELEIHIDVGFVGPTREIIKEVVGIVTGSGFIAKTKPESWGASKVADKHA